MNPERLEKIKLAKELYESGVSKMEILKRTGIPEGSLYAQMRKLGVQIRKVHIHADKYPEAKSLYEQGFSIQDICKYYGQIENQAMGNMWRFLRNRGVKFRPRVESGEKSVLYRGGSRYEERATDLVRIAIRKGILVPAPCEVCGSFDKLSDGRRGVLAHHCDYSKPLSVNWLCPTHHQEWHRKHKAKPSK